MQDTHDGGLAEIAESELVTRRGPFRAVAFRDPFDGHEHLALVRGDPGGRESEHGVTVTGRVPLLEPVDEHNVRYLTAKRDRLGHDLPHLALLGS